MKHFGTISVYFTNNTQHNNYHCKMIITIEADENKYIPDLLRNANETFFGQYLLPNFGKLTGNQRVLEKDLSVKDLSEALNIIEEQKDNLKEIIKANKALMKAIPQNFTIEF